MIREGRGRRREVPIEGQGASQVRNEDVGIKPKENDSEARRAVREYQNKALKNVLERASAMVREEREKNEEVRADNAPAADNEIEAELLGEASAESIRESNTTNETLSDQSQSLFEDVEMEE